MLDDRRPVAASPVDRGTQREFVDATVGAEQDAQLRPIGKRHRLFDLRGRQRLNQALDYLAVEVMSGVRDVGVELLASEPDVVVTPPDVSLLKPVTGGKGCTGAQQGCGQFVGLDRVAGAEVLHEGDQAERGEWEQ